MNARHHPVAALVNTTNPTGPTLSDIEFDRSKTGQRVKVKVAGKLPSGIYTGVVVDRRSGEHLGKMTITVGRA
jgi:hypothetical protein